jgi:hypothetical protein
VVRSCRPTRGSRHGARGRLNSRCGRPGTRPGYPSCRWSGRRNGLAQGLRPGRAPDSAWPKLRSGTRSRRTSVAESGGMPTLSRVQAELRSGMRPRASHSEAANRVPKRTSILRPVPSEPGGKPTLTASRGEVCSAPISDIPRRCAPFQPDLPFVRHSAVHPAAGRKRRTNARVVGACLSIPRIVRMS